MAPTVAEAYEATIAWSPDSQSATQIVGYRIYVRQGPDYTGVVPVDAGMPTPDGNGVLRYTVSGVPMGPTSWFSVNGYTAAGQEGRLSNEISVDYASAAVVVDSDGDGLVDALEDANLDQTVDAGETDPGMADTDGDGLDDYDETHVTGTDPTNADSDGDGYTDGAEIADGTDPNDATSNVGVANAVCGNAVVEPGEECDDGAGNSDADPNACHLDCTLHNACGDATDDGVLTASDAFEILRGAVSLRECPLASCDTDGDGLLSPSDGLRVVRAAVGQDVHMDCGLLVTLVIDEPVLTGTTEVVVDYRDTGSTFVGEADEVRCGSLLPPSVQVSFYNDTARGRLEVTVVAYEDVVDVVELADCRFYSRTEAPSDDEFVVEVVDYPGVGLGSPAPAMWVSY